MSGKKHMNKHWKFTWKSGIFCMLLFVVCGICLKFGFRQEEHYAETGGTKVVTRGVVDTFEQLPETKRKGTTAEIGTPENPFLILEIVPYEEYAEFGYLISGCEPVKVDEMFGRSDLCAVNNIGGGYTESSPYLSYYFADEEKSKAKYYDGTPTPVKKPADSTPWETFPAITVKGYFERVADGAGAFTQDTDTKAITYAGVGNGNIAWYSVQEFELFKYADIGFAEELKLLSNQGDRLYTKRTNDSYEGGNDLYAVYCYKYKNYDYFLNDTLGQSEIYSDKLDTQEKRDNFSIVIKTITPAELNNNLKWIDCANLISISPKSHIGSAPSLWESYNKLGHDGTDGRTNGFMGENDISWNATLAIFKKSIADKDYVAVLMDRTCLTDVPGSDGKSISFKIFNRYGQLSDKTYSCDGYNNNVFKLAVMMMSMDPHLFNSIYLSGENPIIQDGDITLQTGNAKKYWSLYSFLPTPENSDSIGGDFYSYWNKSAMWDDYKIKPGAVYTDPSWTDDRLHTFNGDHSIAMNYMNTGFITTDDESSRFSDFKEYMSTECSGEDANSSDALRYILGLKSNSTTDETKGTLKVLDLEPCVDSKTGFVVNETFFRWLLPTFTGDIEIIHQITAEFNGKIEDLNSTYDLIYMGLDYGAYNTASKYITLRNGGNRTADLPDWNDNNLDGMIYLHTGDKILSSELVKTRTNRSVKWLFNGTNGCIDSTELRFPGNDITKLKQKDLETFLDAGYLIVTAADLYNLETALIDKTSNVYKFVNANKSKNNLASASAISDIANALKNRKPEVTFSKIPTAYVGNTNSATGELVGVHYLEKKQGRAVLDFEFVVHDDSESKYVYKIYVDQNRDGKMSGGEEISNGLCIGNKTAKKECKLSKELVGLVQWKIEIHKEGKSPVRTEKTGFSAVKNDGAKKQIKVLQIAPREADSFDGTDLNLAEDVLFKKYYRELDEYEISIDVISADEYEGYFEASYNDEGEKFFFDKSKPIDFESSTPNPMYYGSTLNDKLDKYNMFIIGFGDAYYEKNISNEYGAVDYIDFYISMGKSILFTHDLTSMNNVVATQYGYSANTLLRDVMGMNRYGVVSGLISEAKRTSIMNYQSDKVYDKATSPYGLDYKAAHGYTYFAMKRLSWSNNGGTNPNVQGNLAYRMPYKNLVNSGGNKYDLSNLGINDYVDLTTTVTQLNEGQITTYPYYIDPSQPFAKTHGQYYQLNLEDEEVTVWYCLGNDGSTENGTGLTYEVSPNDAANNYYIYSKGNVMYSGVGHSKVTEDTEAKLFINTMIAAYRQAYEAPEVIVTNETARMSDTVAYNYTMTLTREYDENVNEAGNVEMKPEEFASTETQRVTFIIRDYNLGSEGSTIKQCKIYYPYTAGDGTEQKYYVSKIYDEHGNEIVPDGDNKYLNLEVEKTYYFDYPKIFLSPWKDSATNKDYPALRTIKFEAMNNKVPYPGMTTLNMTVQALFELD